ncbi:MAG: OmpH family outer membrane protein [Candidatus Omnitrophica bacterium]|nr:OmpH family outer membrane protein [Candidatus Omnitrophota bacterium]
MKLTRILMMVFLGVFVMSLGFTKAGFAKGGGKLAYIDLGKIFSEYQKTKDFDKVLEKEKKDKQAKREKKVEAIRKIKDELEVINKKAKEKKQAEMNQKIKELQEFDREISTELRGKYDLSVREILKEIESTIKEFGQKEKFDVIFDNRMLLYSNDSLSVTDQILKILNERYKRKH